MADTAGSDASAPALPAEAASAPPRSAWLRLALLAALLGAGVGIAALAEPQRLLTEERLGTPGPGVLALYILGYTVCAVLMVPRPVLGLAGGALFGWAVGAVAGLLGTIAAAAATLALGRALGQRALRPLLRGRVLTSADRQLSTHGFRSLMILRLIPVLPFAAVNHAAAVSRMPWGPFLAATTLGCLPVVTAHAVAGHYATDPVSPGFLLAVGFLVILAVVAGGYWRRRSARAGTSAPITAPGVTTAGP